MTSQREIRHRKVLIRDAYSKGISISEICTNFGVTEKYAYGVLTSKDKKAREAIPETREQKSNLELSISDRESLAQSILAIMLTSSKYLTATELAAQLGTGTKNVNSVLYDAKYTYFQKVSNELPPQWTLSGEPIEKFNKSTTNQVENEISQTDVLIHLESAADSRVCSLCSGVSEDLFCSVICRKRSIDSWFKFQFRSVYFSNSTEFLKFCFQNLTREFELSFCEVLSEVCNHSKTISSTMLDMFESHAPDIAQMIECLTDAYNNCDIYEPRNKKHRPRKSLEISVASISTRYRPQVQKELENVGLPSSSSENLSRSQFNELSKLSASAKKHIENLFARREVLLDDYEERFIDEFTLKYLGISDELVSWIGLRGFVRSVDFERYYLDMNKALPSELHREFYDFLVAIQVHSFLPTWRIVQNMELGIPEVLIEEFSSIRSRLIKVLEMNRTRESKSDFDRLIRMLEVLDGVLAGKSLDVLGSEMGISRERVRQIILPIFSQVGVDGLIGLRMKVKRKRQDLDTQKIRMVSELQTEITMFIRQHPGISTTEIGEVFPNNEEEVLDAIKRHGALVLSSFPIQEDQEVKTRSDMIQSLRDASLLAFPLTGASYDELLEQGLISGVTRQRIMQVFGTWVAACESAEVEPGSQIKGVTYVRTYSYKEMLRVVGQFLIDDDLRGYTGGVHSYGGWRAMQELADNLPSDGTIRNQVDASWKRVKELALVELRSSWTSLNSEKHDG